MIYYHGEEKLLFAPVESTANQSTTDSNDVECTICGKLLSLNIMRAHIGCHILRNETGEFCCGYCGGAGCTIALKKTSHNTMKPTSNCEKYVKFSLKAVENSKARIPCTNRPVQCSIYIYSIGVIIYKNILITDTQPKSFQLL